LLSKDEEKVFDNFLSKMVRLDVLVRDSARRGRGAYRFTHLLHHLYFVLEAGREWAKKV